MRAISSPSALSQIGRRGLRSCGARRDSEAGTLDTWVIGNHLFEMQASASWAVAVGLGLTALGCGARDSSLLFDESASLGDSAAVQPESEPVLVVGERTLELISGTFAGEGPALELTSMASSPFAGEVTIVTGELFYALHYDYAARQVVSDAGGAAIDRELQRSLAAALAGVTAYLGPNNPELPLHEQMLYAAVALLQESGGMPLERMTFEIEPTEIEKSLGNDGVSCIKRRQTYAASYDYGSTVVIDLPITADTSECNGRCGPTCIQLTPWNMWTLDCLEHDSCCGATSSDSCWTPLGECGDEYGEAQTDFLRGFDPFRKHCKG